MRSRMIARRRYFEEYAHVIGSPRFQCNNWRYAKLALAWGWCE